MDRFLKSIYLKQVKDECEFCLIAVDNMNKILTENSDEDFFREALDFVHHAAAVSRMFWPPGSRGITEKARAKKRGQILCKELGLQPDHPLHKRTLRDHFEHFDERLDDWAENSKNRNIIIRYTGPRDAIGGNSIEDGDIIHHYDPESKIYSFRGEPFDLQQLVSGIYDINQKVKAFLEIR